MNAFDYFFEQSAGSNKPFLVGREELSFKEIYNKAYNLATYIQQEIGEDKNVMLMSPNNAFFLIVYLAILKSGNTCIPLDPMLEAEKFKYIRDLTKTSMMFMAPQVQKRLSLDEQECITSLEGIADETDTQVVKNTDSFQLERCAGIIFTSGSTGNPKGVMLSHKNLIANTQSIVEYLKLTENDRMLVVLPFYYCYGLSLLHTHLRCGGSLVFNNSFIFHGAVINDLKNHKCTGFAGVPSHFQILLRKSDSFKSTPFPDLRYVTQAGGKLATVFIDEFKAAFPKTDFVVMYGQTEATARLSYLPPELYQQKKGSIGQGIPGVELRVINENEEDIKPGDTGEVIARGDNIMMGYFMDDEATRAAIKAGWLYTGDLGTIDDDGYIYLTARKKEILKVGGKRISPKEVEGVILSMPEVVDCSIEGIEDKWLGEALKATVIVNNKAEKEIKEEAIKAHCAQHLELYKIPHIIEIQEKMNMSATGKKVKNKS